MNVLIRAGLLVAAILVPLTTFGAPSATPFQPAGAARALELVASGDFQRAAEALRELLSTDPQWAQGWYELGIALRNTGDIEGALEAYAKAEALDFAPERIAASRAITESRRGDVDRAIEQLSKASEAMPLAILEQLPLSEAVTADPRYTEIMDRARARAYPCENDPRYRALDFWIGHWTVEVGGEKVGENEITKRQRGCLIHESWTDGYGGRGESMNYFDPASVSWRQVWVDENGGVVLYEGGPTPTGFRFEGANWRATGEKKLARVSLTRRDDGTIHHVIEHSTDGGATWNAVFDTIYRPAAATP